MTQKRRNGAVTGAEWALVIRRGIAEGAEQAFLCGWRRRLVPVAAGDGCRKWRGNGAEKGLGACAPGLLRGIVGVGIVAGLLGVVPSAGDPGVAGLPLGVPVGGCMGPG